jgi:NADH:ubiquinone oxidoreductase subunit 5 (subunit L)/multisubunit Na+/H+ antiporter MnhA subunit
MHHVHESPPVMLVPLFVLAVGALLAGVVFKEYFFGHHYAVLGRRCSRCRTTTSSKNSTMCRCG